ncbi:HAMP domain-containing protein [Curvibacter sp. CHRR-16]|uniref:ATP-binding protein n=1 Tax=Curvibacter sp. CHRR-16 TaxID=2835872 RepID=UPI001BDA59A7|nr:ATP-binding protein [Curvibacter sp. CHRR-16]MBT0571735.1 HAMP domain-containing protein [Curvibacter sp. CHRR-16]
MGRLHFSLQRKLMLALLGFSLSLLLGFVGFSYWGLQRGLSSYVADVELARLDWLVSRLQNYYAQHGSWAGLQTDTNAWRSMVDPRQVRMGLANSGASRDGSSASAQGVAQGRDRAPPAPPFFIAMEDGGRPDPERRPPNAPMLPPPNDAGLNMPQPSELANRPPMPPPFSMGGLENRDEPIHERITLLAADGETVLIQAQVRQAADHPPRIALRHDGELIGYLALQPMTGLSKLAGREFVREQLVFVGWTGLLGGVLAVAVSWWWARRWLMPLRDLMDAAQAVSNGKLDAQVPVRGSDELSHLVHTFNAMTTSLQQTQQQQQQWLADVAHELRTPLAAMRAEIEAIQEGVRQFNEATANRLHKQVLRLTDLVEDLRKSMQARDVVSPVQYAQVQPLELLADVLESMGERMRQAHCECDQRALDDFLLHKQALVMQAVPGQLQQVFFNVLENSLRYTTAPGRLRVQVFQRQSDWLTILMEDSPPAPQPHELPQLFNRLYRGETSRTRALGGAGLGLSICKNIVNNHQGTITAALSELGGLCIEIGLPVQQVDRNG